MAARNDTTARTCYLDDGGHFFDMPAKEKKAMTDMQNLLQFAGKALKVIFITFEKDGRALKRASCMFFRVVRFNDAGNMREDLHASIQRANELGDEQDPVKKAELNRRRLQEGFWDPTEAQMREILKLYVEDPVAPPKAHFGAYSLHPLPVPA